jgi:hypothetical protein
MNHRPRPSASDILDAYEQTVYWLALARRQNSHEAAGIFGRQARRYEAVIGRAVE